MEKDAIDKEDVTHDSEEFVEFFKRQLTVKDDRGLCRKIDITMSLPINIPSSIPEIPSYQCIITINDNGSFSKYDIVGTFDKFNVILNGMIFIRKKIDEIKDEVFYLNQPFSGFPLIISDSFGMEHLKKSEKLITDEYKSLMEELSGKRHAYEKRHDVNTD